MRFKTVSAIQSAVGTSVDFVAALFSLLVGSMEARAVFWKFLDMFSDIFMLGANLAVDVILVYFFVRTVQTLFPSFGQRLLT